MVDIAIIGGGFSGAMVVANLVRQARAPFSLMLFEPSAVIGTGVAYGTPSPLHLLNVRAAKMGAFPDRETHFFEWLQTPPAKALAAEHQLKSDWRETDFAPRLMYGAYIKQLWQEALALAEQKNIRIEICHAAVTSIAPGKDHFLVTAEKTVPAAHLVLATGNPFAEPAVRSDRIVSDVFNYDYAALRKNAPPHLPAVIIGAGLTAVDTFLSLRAVGWSNEIVLLSRRALLPAVHETYQPYTGVLKGTGLLDVLRELRGAARQWEGSWQAVIDALRPRTQMVWQGFSAREKNAFFRRLFTYWNIHRHRMAPEIGAPLLEALRRGEARLLQGSLLSLEETGEGVSVKYTHRGEITALEAAAAFQCIGPDYRSIVRAPMLETLRQEGYLRVSPTGLGVLTDERLAAFEDARTSIHVMGNYLLGELLETTAVPELRQEAALIAQSLLPRLP